MNRLVAFSASQPGQEFTKLLDRLEEGIKVLRKDTQQKQRQKEGKGTYTHGFTSTVRQEVPNVVTRSRAKRPQDGAVLTFRSHSKPKDALSTASEHNIFHSKSKDALRTTSEHNLSHTKLKDALPTASEHNILHLKSKEALGTTSEHNASHLNNSGHLVIKERSPRRN